MKRTAGPASTSVSIDEAVAEILTDVLQLRFIEAHGNVFDLGATSISVIQIAARIERRFAIDVPASAIFDRPTLAELATYVRERMGDGVAQAASAEPASR